MRRHLASQVHGCCGRFDCRGGVRRCPRAELRPLAQEALVGPNEPRELDRNRGLHGATGHLERAAHARWAEGGCLTSLEPAGRRARAISTPHYTKCTSRHPSSPHQIGAAPDSLHAKFEHAPTREHHIPGSPRATRLRITPELRVLRARQAVRQRGRQAGPGRGQAQAGLPLHPQGRLNTRPAER